MQFALNMAGPPLIFTPRGLYGLPCKYDNKICLYINTRLLSKI